MQTLVHIHSGFRWIVLLLLIGTVVNALLKSKSGVYSEGDRKISLWALITSHIQLLIGSVLFFISPKVVFAAESMKNAIFRFFLVEHSLMMIIAIVLITMGYSKAKKQTEPARKFRTTLIFYGIGLLVILLGIPWPFRHLGTAWF